MFEKISKEDDRGQVGIGTLIVFIAMVLVAAIAAGVLINTAGFLQSSAEQTGQESQEQVTNRLQILSATGEKTTDSTSSDAIGKVALTSTKAPGADDIDLSEVTIQWVDDQGTYNLIDETSADADGTFDYSPFKDNDGSSPVINSPDDRIDITITLADPTTNPDGPEWLAEGDVATLRITTSSGTATTERLVVPESLSGTTAANL